MATKDLEQRVRVLEAIEEIRALKSRYFHCCDRKDPKGVRRCFADGAVYIDYGAVGKFDSADALVKVFTDLACHDHMVEMHHGVNPQIELVDSSRALGKWKLHYQLVNTKENTLTQMAGFYEDEYKVSDGVWRISRTRFVATQSVVMKLGEDGIKTVFAGRPPRADQ